MLPAGMPQSSHPVKIRKWIKTSDVIRFEEDEREAPAGTGNETSAHHAIMGVDTTQDLMTGGSTTVQTSAPTIAETLPSAEQTPAAEVSVHEASETRPPTAAEAGRGQNEGLLSTTIASSAAVPGDATSENSQLLTQASLPSSDPLDRASTQEDRAAAGIAAGAAVAAAPAAKDETDAARETAKGLEGGGAHTPAVSIDAPLPIDASSTTNPLPAAPASAEASASPLVATSADVEQARIAEGAEVEAQQGGTQDGSLPAEEFLPHTADT